MANGKRVAGRPTAAVVTRELLVERALALLDRSGPGGLSLNALARDIGVAPSALYNHVANKRELLIGIQDHVIADIDLTCFENLPVADAFAVWARELRVVLARRPGLIQIYAVTPVTDSPAVLAMYERASDCLLRAGVAADAVLDVLVAVESFVVGSAIDKSAPADVFDVGADAESYPNLALADRSSTARGRADRAFESGVRALVAGLLSAAVDSA